MFFYRVTVMTEENGKEMLSEHHLSVADSHDHVANHLPAIHDHIVGYPKRWEIEYVSDTDDPQDVEPGWDWDRDLYNV